MRIKEIEEYTKEYIGITTHWYNPVLEYADKYIYEVDGYSLFQRTDCSKILIIMVDSNSGKTLVHSEFDVLPDETKVLRYVKNISSISHLTRRMMVVLIAVWWEIISNDHMTQDVENLFLSLKSYLYVIQPGLSDHKQKWNESMTGTDLDPRTHNKDSYSRSYWMLETRFGIGIRTPIIEGVGLLQMTHQNIMLQAFEELDYYFKQDQPEFKKK